MPLGIEEGENREGFQEGAEIKRKDKWDSYQQKRKEAQSF